jgi:hypothetical protein
MKGEARGKSFQHLRLPGRRETLNTLDFGGDGSTSAREVLGEE